MSADDNGHDLQPSDEQRMIALVAASAVLFIRIGRDGAVLLSGDVITMGDDVRAYGLLEKLRQSVGLLCQQRRAEIESRILPPPAGFRP